ncbi:hypothetical protein HMPREF1249_0240 [Jonquetella sp. BV3C21]|nr:hypothetical protein HMPREF1249_0240 [Jonquetella sp. BV3C21]
MTGKNKGVTIQKTADHRDIARCRSTGAKKKTAGKISALFLWGRPTRKVQPQDTF